LLNTLADNHAKHLAGTCTDNFTCPRLGHHHAAGAAAAEALVDLRRHAASLLLADHLIG
jgi:hypothetical protein